MKGKILSTAVAVFRDERVKTKNVEEDRTGFDCSVITKHYRV